MAVYAIGDLQGCFDELQQLLDKIGFQTERDQLWFVGDLVNRGSQSLECLRFITELGDNAISVLGNHDLNLLACGHGLRKITEQDTFNDILEAKDSSRLLDWLRHRPLLHRDSKLNYVMVHAGLPPQWSITEAQALADEVEMQLRGDQYLQLLSNMYGNQPDQWSAQLPAQDRQRFIINCFTRMRYCTLDGKLDLNCKGPPGSQPKNLQPWFKLPNRQSSNNRIVFGHWSTLTRNDKTNDENVYPLDTGCVWGKCLTAMRLDSELPEYISVSCTDKKR